MAKVVKPKLVDTNSNIKFNNYTFNGRTNNEEHIDLLSYVDDSLKELFSGIKSDFQEKIVDPILNDPLSDGSISSFLDQFHIFDDVGDEEVESDSNNPVPDSPSQDNVSDDIKNKSVDELAQEVIDGKYGSGQERRDALGDRYDEVQQRVNEILNNKTPKTPTTPTTDTPSKPDSKPSPDNSGDDKPQEQPRGNGIPAKDENGYIIRQKSDAGQRVINMLLANGDTNSPHPASLDAAIDALSAEECAWVLSRIENEGFGQTSDGYYHKSVEGDQNFIDRQLIRRYNGDIHNLLKAWGTYSYSGY